MRPGQTAANQTATMLLINREYHAETVAVRGSIREVDVAVARTEVVPVVEPRTALDDLIHARLGSHGVLDHRIGGQILDAVVVVEPIGAPLVEVSVHVVEAPRVGLHFPTSLGPLSLEFSSHQA